MVKLYDYQEKYLENMPKNVIMSADVGLGKTIMAVEHARRWGVKHIVVVAPASKVRTGDWQREIEKFFMAIAHLTKTTVPEYTVLSYEMFTKRAKEFENENITLIIDECHFICSATAKRSKAIIKVAKQAHQWIGLSATPLPNGWKSGETYAILTGLVKNKTEFVNTYEIIDRSRGFPILFGYRFKEVLEQWWAGISRPLPRTGKLVLPSQSIAVHATMPPKTIKVYQHAVKERVYVVGDEVELLDNTSKLFVTLRQIPNAARVDALQSIVESTDEHIVVFYNFNSERDAVLEMLEKSFKGRKVYEQSGHKSDLPSRDKWANLKPSVTLVQYQSGSQAIELTYASVTVYLSPPTSYANYEQSKGRTRRNGQEKTTLFYHIAAENSLDGHIWHLVKNKQDFSTGQMQKTLELLDKGIYT